MRAKIIIAMATVAFVGTLSVGSEALARGGKGGHGGGKSSAWAGKSMHGMHGKHGHHFPGQMHHAHGKHNHGKHDHGHKQDHAHAQGVRHKSGKSSDSRRDWQAGSFSGGGGYGGSVGDICINSQFCQGVWYQVTKSGSRPSQSSATYQRNWQAGGE